MPGGTVPVNNTWLTEKVPVNKFSLNKQTSKLKLVLENSSGQYFHPSLLANNQTTNVQT